MAEERFFAARQRRENGTWLYCLVDKNLAHKSLRDLYRELFPDLTEQEREKIYAATSGYWSNEEVIDLVMDVQYRPLEKLEALARETVTDWLAQHGLSVGMEICDSLLQPENHFEKRVIDEFGSANPSFSPEQLDGLWHRHTDACWARSDKNTRRLIQLIRATYSQTPDY